MANLINIGNITMGRGAPLVLISGPCVIEDYETTREIAASLKEITRKLEIPFIFKASYDKANRTSVTAFRGPGLTDGLKMLEEIKTNWAFRSSPMSIASAKSPPPPGCWTSSRFRLFYAARLTSFWKLPGQASL